MAKKPEIFLEHILAAIIAIEKFTDGLAKNEFKANDEKQSAVFRKFEIIGEAIKNIPLAFRNKYPDVEWKKAAGMRDKMIHEYFGLDLSLVWKTTKDDLPVLKRQIEEILESMNNNQQKLI